MRDNKFRGSVWYAIRLILVTLVPCGLTILIGYYGLYVLNTKLMEQNITVLNNEFISSGKILMVVPIIYLAYLIWKLSISVKIGETHLEVKRMGIPIINEELNKLNVHVTSTRISYSNQYQKQWIKSWITPAKIRLIIDQSGKKRKKIDVSGIGSSKGERLYDVLDNQQPVTVMNSDSKSIIKPQRVS